MKAESVWRRSELKNEEWERVALSSLYSVKYGKANPGRPGNVPVVGSSGVYAWTENPLILHSTIVVGRKGSAGQAWLVEVPSYPSDTTFYLEPHDPTHTDIRFTYFALRYFQISASDDVIPSLQRHELENLILPFPPLPEQCAIAAVLSKIQAAVEVQDKIIATLKELKAATMAKLFREGLRGEPLKQTEIGEIPQSWEVVPLGQLTESSAFGPRFSAALYSQNGNVATLRTTDIDEGGSINYATMPTAMLDIEKFGTHLLKDSDLVITRSGTCGIAAVFEPQPLPVLPGAFLIRVRLSSHVSPHFLHLWINSPLGRPCIQKLATGAVQKNISGTSLATLLVPVPERDQQEEIVRELSLLEQRLSASRRRHDTLKTLFSSMLHLLMTGQVRGNTLKVEKVGR